MLQDSSVLGEAFFSQLKDFVESNRLIPSPKRHCLIYYYRKVHLLFFLIVSIETLDFLSSGRLCFPVLINALDSSLVVVVNLCFSCGIRNGLTYEEDSNAKVTCAIFTHVKHIIMLVKITFFTWVNEYLVLNVSRFIGCFS